MLELVIFDCDGVLVDSEELANRVLVEALNAQGLELSFEQVLELFRGRSLVSCEKIINQRLGHRLAADFWDVLQQHTFAAFARQLQTVDGIEEVLDVLPYRSCVASSGDYIKLAYSLSLTGLERYFGTAVYSAQQVLRGKPAPDLFLYAAQRCRVKPANACVIEDSKAGVEAALAAKMPVFWYQGPTEAPAGCVSFEHMQQLPALLARLNHA